MGCPVSRDGYTKRPMISVSSGKFLHDGSPVRVVLRKSGVFSVGCSDVTIEACRELVRLYDDWQRDIEMVVQP